jgi:hypothetical protein
LIDHPLIHRHIITHPHPTQPNPTHPSIHQTNQAAKRWPKFFKAINWVQGEHNVYLKWPAEFVYSFDAAKGHMPLTNALRGTQLFQAIMEHPAFAASKGGKGSGASAMSIDDRSKAAGMDTLKF